MQIARQVVKLNASDLRLPSRAWKVKLVGEGADDAGGVFDDTITEMCQVRTDRHVHSTYVTVEIILYVPDFYWMSWDTVIFICVWFMCL